MNKIIKSGSTKGWNTVELMLNHIFTKDHEAFYRDYDREISLLDLMREICSKHASPADANELDDDTLNEVLYDNLQFGTNELEGIFALYYFTAVGMAEVRERLKVYEQGGLPAIEKPDAVKQAVSVWGKKAQLDMAIEEMSELTKEILKERRAAAKGDLNARKTAADNIAEETADVIIMLFQIIAIFDCEDRVQEIINFKVDRLEQRLTRMKEAANSAASGAAQEALQPAT